MQIEGKEKHCNQKGQDTAAEEQGLKAENLGKPDANSVEFTGQGVFNVEWDYYTESVTTIRKQDIGEEYKMVSILESCFR